MKAIDTRYHGYKFRSRLEARWAVFFDTMGIKWEYEKEGFKLGEFYYLPDFWMPQVKMWAEVKPNELNQHEKQLCQLLAMESRQPVLMLVEAPSFINYDAYQLDPWSDTLMVYDYTLIIKMIRKGEHRFPCCNFLPSGNPECYPLDYALAVEAARSARFEHGEKPWHGYTVQWN
jgi:hypothetical protein